jgi:hypothetical protein
VDEWHEQAIFRVACELHIDGGPDRLRVLVRELLEVQVDFVGSLLRRADARRPPRIRISREGQCGRSADRPTR